MTSCIVTSCGDYYADFERCTNYTGIKTPATLPCICTASAIADYTKCYPCYITIPGESAVLTPVAYTAACANNGLGIPSIPSITNTGSQPTPGTSGSGGNSNGSGSSSSNTGMYIGIGCGVAAVIIAVGMFFFFRNKKNRKAAAAAGASKTDGVPPVGPPPMQQVHQNQFAQTPGVQQQQQPFQPQFQQPPLQQFQPQPQYQQSPYQQQQPIYAQQQPFQQQQFVSQQPPTSTYYAQHQQQQPVYQDQSNLYPTVATPPVQPHPTPSPKFSTADPYQSTLPTTPRAQEGIATAGFAYDQQHQVTTSGVSDYPPPTPMPMPGQSHAYPPPPPATVSSVSPSVAGATPSLAASSSPLIVNSATMYDYSPAAVAAFAATQATTKDAVSKPMVSQHGPQFYATEQERAGQPATPGNPQLVSFNEGAYHQ